MANIVNEYLNEVGIRTMEWPAHSSDINLIENLWDQLGRLIRQRQCPPETFRQLRTAIVEMWKGIPHEQISNVIQSRLKAVKQARERGYRVLGTIFIC
jgi:transposase